MIGQFKKYFIFILIFICGLSLTGCQSKESEPENSQPKESQSENNQSIDYYMDNAIEVKYKEEKLELSHTNYYLTSTNEYAFITFKSATYYLDGEAIDTLPELTDGQVFKVYYEMINYTAPITIHAIYVFL